MRAVISAADLLTATFYLSANLAYRNQTRATIMP